MPIRVLVFAAALSCFMIPGPARDQELIFLTGSTVKVGQLTGDLDRTVGIPTLSRTRSRFGIDATDLGSSFEHRGRLFFLFGDTWGRPGDLDAIGWTSSREPDKIKLNFHNGADGKWHPPRVSGIEQGAFEIPSGGISVDGVMYVIFTTDHSREKTMGRSVLARSRDDGRTFEQVYELSRDRFINVSFWRDGGWIYLFGSGEYRKSSPRLARIPAASLEDHSRWEYLNPRAADGRPTWSSNETDAAPLFTHDVIGEFSVAYLPPVRRYVMLYNSHRPRGITLRSAEKPWGPWSEGSVIFDPHRDGGYGKFMHVPAGPGRRSTTFNDRGREKEWGGEYGPYLMARYTRPLPAGCRIYYTLSTWNPYQVVIMKTDLRLGRPAS